MLRTGLQNVRSLVHPKYENLAVYDRMQERDFSTGAMLPDLVFTRGSGATYTDYNGIIHNVTNNQPRIDLFTTVDRGLLIEEARTNLYTQSTDLSGAEASSNVTKNFNALTSPDGTVNGANFVSDNTAGTHWISINNSVSITASAPFSMSGFFKRVGIGTNNQFFRFAVRSSGWEAICGVNIDLENGIVSKYQGGTGTVGNVSIEDVGNGWWWVKVEDCILDVYTSALSESIPTATLAGSTPTTGDNVNGIGIYQTQFELGAFSTSPIPTAGATATRSSDYNSTDISNIYTKKTSTFLFECQSFVSGQNGVIFEARNTADTDRISLYIASGGVLTLEVVTNSVTQTSRNYALPSPNGLNQIALTIEQDNLKVYVNGVEVSSDIAITPPNLDTLWLGETSWSSWYWNGWFKKVKYYPAVKTTGEVGNL